MPSASSGTTTSSSSSGQDELYQPNAKGQRAMANPVAAKHAGSSRKRPITPSPHSRKRSAAGTAAGTTTTPAAPQAPGGYPIEVDIAGNCVLLRGDVRYTQAALPPQGPLQASVTQHQPRNTHPSLLGTMSSARQTPQSITFGWCSGRLGKSNLQQWCVCHEVQKQAGELARSEDA